MSVMAAPRVLTRRRLHFLLVAVVVAMVVAPGHAHASRLPSLPPHQPQSLPHSPQRLPLLSLFQRWPHKGVVGVRPRRVRSALAPPTVTSLRPPDRSLSGQRQAGMTGGVGSGGSSGNSGPPVVASQSPSSASIPSHHVYHDRHNRQGSMAPVATAASGSRSLGGHQPTSRQGTSGTQAEEGGEGIHILRQESSSGRDSSHPHNEATASRTRLAQGNRDSTTWNGDLVIESRKIQKMDNESQTESGESLSVNHESEWQGGELSGDSRVLDWGSDNLQGGRKDKHGWARVEESVGREREGSPVLEEQWWRESGVGGGAAEGEERVRQSTPRNDTYGHAITEDLAHLSSGQTHLWRPRGGGGGGGGGPLSPSLAGRRRNQATRNRHVWVLEEVEEEEAEGEKEESKEVRMYVENIPQVANADFVNAYIHAAQHYQESKREEQMQPRGGASSNPSSSSPSSSHPSIYGSSYYPTSTSLSSSSPPHSSSSATYSSSNLRDDLSPFHQSLAPQQPRPSSSQDDEYEPEDYTNYHEYDHHSRNTLPQDNTWHPRTSKGQKGNAATHWDQQQGDLGMRRPTNVNTRHNDFSFSDDEREAGENGYLGEERVNVSGSSPSASPEREREINVGASDNSEEQNQRRNRKKDRRNKGKGRRDRERGRKNRRGRNKGGRRWRQGRKQSTTPIPLSPSSPITTVDNETQAPASTTLTPDTPLEQFLSTEVPVGMSQSSPQPAVNLSTQAPIHPQTLTTSTTSTLLPPTPSAVPTTPSRAVPSQTTVTIPQATTHILPQGSPLTPNGKTALVSEITVTVMETRTDENDDITVIENLRPARRRPKLQGKHHENNNRGHRGEDRPREGIYNNEDGSERDPVKTEVEIPTERTNFSREQQRDGYRFPVKGILIISGLMGALAVFTLVVLISYAVIKCSKKPVVNNYKVSEQKNEVPS